jgi:spore coat polysaccharide biosynthesis predicted glycosyltransferase SpsG
MKLKELVIAAQATHSTGAGHLRRCMRLSQGWGFETKKLLFGKVEISWLIPSATANFELFEGPPKDLINPLVILDSYEEDFCRGVKDFFSSCRIIQIADRYTPILDEIKILWLDFPDGDIFERHQLNIVASGLEYMPINSIEKVTKELYPVAKNVLVTTGGNPSVAANAILYRCISKESFKDVTFHVIGEKPPRSIKAQNIFFYQPGEAQEILSASVDTVITACGTSLWDFLANHYCVGALMLFDNQARNFDFVTSEKHVVPLDLNKEELVLKNSLEKLLFDSELRQRLLATTSKFYDFQGYQRFYELVQAL